MKVVFVHIVEGSWKEEVGSVRDVEQCSREIQVPDMLGMQALHQMF